MSPVNKESRWAREEVTKSRWGTCGLAEGRGAL